MGSVTTDQNISVANGNFQTIIVGSNVTLTLADLNQNTAMESVIVSVLIRW